MSVHTPHAHHYRVTHQEQHLQPAPEGGLHKVWTVHLEHQNGVKGTIELPDTHYTAENVHDLASQQAEDVARVGALPASVTGQPAPAAEH